MTFHAFRIFNKQVSVVSAEACSELGTRGHLFGEWLKALLDSQGTCLFRHSWGVDVEVSFSARMHWHPRYYSI